MRFFVWCVLWMMGRGGPKKKVVDDSCWTKIGQRDCPVWNMVVDDSFWTIIGLRDGSVQHMVVDDSFLDKNRTTRRYGTAHGHFGQKSDNATVRYGTW